MVRENGERHQRLLRRPTRLQEAQEIRALPQLRDPQVQRAGAGLQLAVAIAVAPGLAAVATLVAAAVIVSAYVICAVLTAIAAIFFAMYTRSISPASHGNFYELYAIAAAVLGGFSLRGGEGSIVGVVLGAVLLQMLQNLVNLLGIPSSLNFAVMGSVILIGVIADQQFAAYRLRRTVSRNSTEPALPQVVRSPKANF